MIDKASIEQFMNAKSETLGWWARNNLRSILSAIFSAVKEMALMGGR